MPSKIDDHNIFATAAEHACTSIPVVSPLKRAGEVRHDLEEKLYESASHIIVCEGDKFLGVVRIEDLLSARHDVLMENLADRKAPVVAPGTDQEVAAWQAVRHKESALSVVDSQGRFVGIIPPHRLLAVLLSEHEEDLSRLGGFFRSMRKARASSEEPVERRFWHRLPWLILGLAGALFAADLVGRFETQLKQKLMLAFVIPGIVYLADAVGTQTETIVVRGLSVGVSMSRMIWRELAAGLVLGLAIGIIATPIIWWRWGDVEIAISVGFSLFAACSTASLIAMALPWLFNALRLDPAFGSGPLATVIQDLLSILIYFLIATWVLR